jgi:hypothetical protein
VGSEWTKESRNGLEEEDMKGGKGEGGECGGRWSWEREGEEEKVGSES